MRGWYQFVVQKGNPGACLFDKGIHRGRRWLRLHKISQRSNGHVRGLWATGTLNRNADRVVLGLCSSLEGNVQHPRKLSLEALFRPTVVPIFEFDLNAEVIKFEVMLVIPRLVLHFPWLFGRTGQIETALECSVGTGVGVPIGTQRDVGKHQHTEGRFRQLLSESWGGEEKLPKHNHRTGVALAPVVCKMPHRARRRSRCRSHNCWCRSHGC